MPDDPTAFEYEVTGESNRPVVHLRGDVDLRSSPPLRDKLIEIVETRPQRVVLELGGVGYMDSSGVGTIVELKRRLDRTGGEIVLVAMQDRVRSVFEITRLDSFFRIVASLDEVDEP